MSNFKAADYAEYNHRFGFDKYEYLYSLMEELFTLLMIDENKYDDDTFFVYSGMKVYIDKKFGSYCEVLNSGWLPMDERIKIHQNKIKLFKNNIIQLTLF